MRDPGPDDDVLDALMRSCTMVLVCDRCADAVMDRGKLPRLPGHGAMPHPDTPVGPKGDWLSSPQADRTEPCGGCGKPARGPRWMALARSTHLPGSA